MRLGDNYFGGPTEWIIKNLRELMVGGANGQESRSWSNSGGVVVTLAE